MPPIPIFRCFVFEQRCINCLSQKTYAWTVLAYLVRMTLLQAFEIYPEARFNPSLFAHLPGHEKESLQTCLSFLERVLKSKGQNRSHDSYGYKHIVENYTGISTSPGHLMAEPVISPKGYSYSRPLHRVYDESDQI